MSILRSRCWISQPFATPGLRSPQGIEFTALWDTGASNSLVSKAVVEECSLRRVGFDLVTGIGGTFRSPAYLANLALPGGIRIRDLRMTQGAVANADILIGMDVIGRGDFAVSNFEGVTKFSFRVPSLEHIEFEDSRT